MRYVGHSLAAVAAIATLGAAAPSALAQAAPAAAQSATVIVLNYQQLLQTSVAGRDIQAKMQQIQTAAQQEVAPEAQAIETERQRIATATQGMNEEQVRANTVLVAQIQALNSRVNALRQRSDAIAHDLQCTEQTALNHFNEAITPTVRQVMTERGAGVVIDRQSVQLLAGDYDATARVLSLIDQSVRTVDVARTPAATCEPAQQAAAPAAPAAPAQPAQGANRRRHNN